MRTFLILSLLFLTACSSSLQEKDPISPTPVEPPVQAIQVKPTPTPLETGSVDIGKQSVIEVSGSLVQPIR